MKGSQILKRLKVCPLLTNIHPKVEIKTLSTLEIHIFSFTWINNRHTFSQDTLGRRNSNNITWYMIEGVTLGG